MACLLSLLGDDGGVTVPSLAAMVASLESATDKIGGLVANFWWV